MTRKNIDPEAVYTIPEIQRIIATARPRGPLAFALTAWTYEFGARTAEPGLQLLRDLDLPNNRARPVHLKSGAAKSWQFLLPYCEEALPLWIAARPAMIKTPEQAPYLFPSKMPGMCYPCHGTGQRAKLLRDGNRRFDGEKVPCHHCGATGKRWGLDRREVFNIVAPILTAAGMPKGRRHPHTLRHSIITNMLNSGVEPKVIQTRVGHRALQTTLGYVQASESARAEVVDKMKALYRKE